MASNHYTTVATSATATVPKCAGCIHPATGFCYPPGGGVGLHLCDGCAAGYGIPPTPAAYTIDRRKYHVRVAGLAISIGQTLSEAEDGAEDATRRSGDIAEIWLDDKLICTVYPPENFEYPLCGACGEPASCEWGNVHGVRLVCNECFYALRDAEAVLHG